MKAPGGPRRILVTGASRGLGLEFTRQWLADGRQVFALARNPRSSDGLLGLRKEHGERLALHACDVADPHSILRACAEVASATGALDLVLNNAGTYGKQRVHIEDLQVEKILPVFEVNTLGPLRVSQACLPLLRKGQEPKLVHVTSLMGSIEDNQSGRSYAYRLSKAALNMASRTMARDLAPARILSAVIHPGWVQTDMGGASAPLSVEESVASMIRTIDALTFEQSGGFFDRDGGTLPW